MTNVDAGSLDAVTGFEGNSARAEALEIVVPDMNSVPSQFDPAQSYGQTRTALESEFESRYVSWLLERKHGNLSAAAREARMDRKHLHDLAKKHGLRTAKTTARP